MRTLFAYLLAVVVIAAGVVFAFFDLLGGGVDTAARASPRLAPVIVAAVGRAPFVDSLSALGTAIANESVRLTVKRSDRVVALHFADGEQVAAGALLVELDTVEERAQMAEAQALCADRRAAHQRAIDLLAQQIAPQSEVDSAKAQLDAAQARVAMLQAQIDDHMVRAPFAGMLGLRQISVGAFLQPSTMIATLDDLSVIKVDFTIPETWLSAVKVGMSIAAQADAWPDDAFPGLIAAIDTQLDPRTRSATVRARVPNDERKLRPGMLMRVAVDRGERDVLQVPEEALVQVGDEHFVLVVGDDSIARRTTVQIGRRRVGHVEILSGLDAGARVVVEGLVRVQSGAPVEVVGVREGRS